MCLRDFIVTLFMAAAIALLLAGCEAPPITQTTPAASRPLPTDPGPPLAAAAGEARGLVADTRGAAEQQQAILRDAALVGEVSEHARGLFEPLVTRVLGNMKTLDANVLPKIDVAVVAIGAMRQQYTELRTHYDGLAKRVETSEAETLKAKQALKEERESGLRTARIWLGIGAAALAAIGGLLIFFGVPNGNLKLIAGGAICLVLAGATVAMAIWLVEFSLVCGGVLAAAMVVLGVWGAKVLLDKVRQQHEQVALQEVTKAQLAKAAPAVAEQIFGAGKEVLQHLSADTLAAVDAIRANGNTWVAPSPSPSPSPGSPPGTATGVTV